MVKRVNPLKRNPLVIAGKNKSELDSFLEEEDNEVVAEKSEKVVPVNVVLEKIEIKEDDKIKKIDQEKESIKLEPENIVKTENKIDEVIHVKQDDASDMSDTTNIPSVLEIKEQESTPEQVEVIKIPEVNIPEIKQPKDKEDKEEKISSGFIVIKQKEASVEKKNVTYRLKQENIDRVERYAGKGKGKSGYNKSELVDILLEKAFGMMKIK